MLAGDEIARFERVGYTVVRGAVPADVMAACQAEVAAGLRAAGVDPHDPATWSAPVVRLACPESPAFAAAGTQPALWSVYYQLLGSGTWWQRPGVGGTIPVRFPHEADPGDTGWHIDGSYEVDGDYWVNVASPTAGGTHERWPNRALPSTGPSASASTRDLIARWRPPSSPASTAPDPVLTHTWPTPGAGHRRSGSCMNRHGVPQITPIAANRTHPDRLTRSLVRRENDEYLQSCPILALS